MGWVGHFCDSNSLNDGEVYFVLKLLSDFVRGLEIGEVNGVQKLFFESGR